MGISADTGEGALAANNFFGLVRHGYAMGFHLNQRDRMVGNRHGLCRRNAAYANVVAACPRRVLFAQPVENRADGNIYDTADRTGSFYISAPTAHALDLDAWKEYYGLDAAGSEIELKADLCAETLVLRISAKGAAGQVAAATASPLPYPAAGPFTPAQWKSILGDGLEVQLPLRPQ
jgi:hypothetical protein